MGSGSNNQPFQTFADYNNWIQRAIAFPALADSAIVYFKKGISANKVLPKAIVIKMIPQMQAMVTDSATKSLFYEPIWLMSGNFTDADKKKLAEAYTALIMQQIIPAYQKLALFLKTVY